MVRFTLAEISGALSRVLSVAPDSAVIGRFAGQLEHSINSRPDLQKSGLGGSGFQTLVLSQLPTEVADLMNPAKLQEMQRRQAENANPTGAQPATPETIAASLLDRRSLVSGDDRQGSRERAASSATEGLSAIKADNFAGTPFAAAGLSYSTFAALRALGFGESNIMHAAQDARVNGFNPDNRKIAGAFATLDKDDGHRRDERNGLLQRFRDRMDRDEDLQNLGKRREEARSPQERAEIERRMEERAKAVSEDVGLREHINSAPTPRARDAGRLIESETIRQRVHGNLEKALGKDRGADLGSAVEALDRLRRDPNDAEAHKRVSSFERKALETESGRKALANIAVDLKRDAKLKADEIGSNEKKATTLASKEATLDALDDELSALVKPAAASPEVKKAEAPKKSDEAVAIKSAELAKPKAKTAQPSPG